MRFFLSILLVSVMPALAGYYPAPQNAAAVQVVGIEQKANGNLGYVSLDDVVVQVETNDFTVINGTLYAKNINSGDYVSLSTNLSAVAVSGYFITTPRIILGSVPNFEQASADGLNSGGGTDPSAPAPAVQWSADNGVSWHGNDETTNVPVIISVYCPTTYADAAISNVVVYSYVNPARLGQTNDYSGQVIYVDMTTASKSVVNVAGAHVIGATEAANWAAYPATSQVNVNGQGVKLNSIWSVTTTSNAYSLKSFGVPVVNLYPAGSALGTNAIISALAVTNTTLTFTVATAAGTAPAILWRTNLNTGTDWQTLTQTTNWTSGGSWFIVASKPNPDQAFFKATSASVSGPAIFELPGGGTRYTQTATAPTTAFIGGDATHTNHLLLNVAGALVDFWSNGTTVWSKNLAP